MLEKVKHCPARYCPALHVEEAVHATQARTFDVVLPELHVLFGAYIPDGQLHATHSVTSFVVEPLHGLEMNSPDEQPLGLQSEHTVSSMVAPEQAMRMYCPAAHLLVQAVHVPSYRDALDTLPRKEAEQSLEVYSSLAQSFPQVVMHLLLSTVSRPVHWLLNI